MLENEVSRRKLRERPGELYVKRFSAQATDEDRNVHLNSPQNGLALKAAGVLNELSHHSGTDLADKAACSRTSCSFESDERITRPRKRESSLNPSSGFTLRIKMNKADVFGFKASATERMKSSLIAE